MKRTRIYYKKKVRLNEPLLLVCLPGIGNIGSLVGEHIKNELGAKKFAVVYSPYFPHQTIMQKGGGLRLISNRFYHFKNKKGQSILILLGDTQASTPKGQYEVNDKIVRFFKTLGGKAIYTVGGYSAGNQYVHNPKVFGVATSKKLRDMLSKYGIVFGQISGTIWGSAGLIPAFSKIHKLDSACIMGETGLLEIDANAAKAVLSVIKKIIAIDISMDNLENIKKETEKIIKNIEETTMTGQNEPVPARREDYSYIR